MKTPEEIKKGLECCTGSDDCDGCPYRTIDIPDCMSALTHDSIGYVQQLKDRFMEGMTRIPRWTSVDDELPEEYVSVLGCMGDAGFLSVHECYLTGSGFLFPALGEYRPVKYWACMPEPPKEEHHD